MQYTPFCRKRVIYKGTIYFSTTAQRDNAVSHISQNHWILHANELDILQSTEPCITY